MTYWMVRLMALCGMAYAIKLPKLRDEPEDGNAPRHRPVQPRSVQAPEAGGDEEAELAAVGH
jgi:hypothetical protein